MLKAKDVMESLNISRPTVYKLIEAGEIPSIKIGGSIRIDERDLQKYIDKKRKAAGII